MKKTCALILMLVATVSLAHAEYASNADVEVLSRGYFEVVAHSASNQSRYAALKSAQIEARAALLRIISKSSLVNNDKNTDGALAESVITDQLSGDLPGAYVAHEEYFKDEGYAKVVMRLNVTSTAIRLHRQIYLKELNEIEKLEKYKLLPADNATTTAALPKPTTPIKYDGLIVVVTDPNFKAVMEPAIVTQKNKKVFSISQVPQELSIAELPAFALTKAKAKAILLKRGSSTPLVVTSSKVKNKLQVIVSEEDAKTIMTNDKEYNFLATLKVAFVCPN